MALQLPQRVSANAGETTVMVLLVVGAEGPVTFEIEGLPPFASVEDNIIRMVPSVGDVGETTVTVTATDGKHSSSSSFVIVVTAINTPPRFYTYPSIVDARGEIWFGPYYSRPLPSPVYGALLLYGDGVNSTGEAMELVAELRPAGEPFTGVPTHRSGLQSCMALSVGCFAALRLTLPDVEVGKHYELAAWLRDARSVEGGPRRVHEDFVRIE